MQKRSLPKGSAGKESTCNVGDLGLIPVLGRSPGEGKGYPLQYSGLENFIDCSSRGRKESDMTEQISLSFKKINWVVYRISTRAKQLTPELKQPGMSQCHISAGFQWRDHWHGHCTPRDLLPPLQNLEAGAAPSITAITSWMLQRGYPAHPSPALGKC